MNIKSLAGAALIAAMTVSAPVWAQSGNSGNSGTSGNSGNLGTNVDNLGFAAAGNLVIIALGVGEGGGKAVAEKAKGMGPMGGMISKIATAGPR